MKSKKQDAQATADQALAQADREQQRRLAELDQMGAGQKEAAALTSDLQSVYGLRSLKNQNGTAFPVAPVAPVASDGPKNGQMNFGGKEYQIPREALDQGINGILLYMLFGGLNK
jgi:hypothetical protein